MNVFLSKNIIPHYRSFCHTFFLKVLIFQGSKAILYVRSLSYIADELIEPKIAEGMFSSIEDAILSLDEFPYRGSERKVGVYANKGYRQLFVKNFTIIYRVDEFLKQVIVVTVRYSPSHF